MNNIAKVVATLNPFMGIGLAVLDNLIEDCSLEILFSLILFSFFDVCHFPVPQILSFLHLFDFFNFFSFYLLSYLILLQNTKVLSQLLELIAIQTNGLKLFENHVLFQTVE